LRDLLAQHAYGAEVVPTGAPGGEIDASELALHNDPAQSMWMAIGGRVYDVTRFADIHPGGEKLIQSFAGMDATSSYRLVEHHRDAVIEELLAVFEIGTLRAADDDRWARTLNVLVEIENAHRMDTSIGCELPLSAFRVQFAVEAHRRFLDQTLGIVCRRIAALDRAADAEGVLSADEAHAAAERCDELERALGRDSTLIALDSTLEALHGANAAFLRRAKTLVAGRTSLAVFPELARAHLAGVAADEFSVVGRS
jgi:cytochrome b involved in lipid metabolism